MAIFSWIFNTWNTKYKTNNSISIKDNNVWQIEIVMEVIYHIDISVAQYIATSGCFVLDCASFAFYSDKMKTEQSSSGGGKEPLSIH